MATTAPLIPTALQGLINSATDLNKKAPALPTNAAFTAPGSNGQFGVGHTQLTLSNGMTAGIGADGSAVSNPPLPTSSQAGASVHPYGGNPNTQPQRVGVMRNVPGSLPSGKTSYLYFIYNPNQIQANFQTNISQIPALYLYGTGGASATSSAVQNQNNTDFSSGSSAALGASTPATNVPNLTTGQTVSWSLIFDRTYDMMYDPNPGDNRGVLKDTAALYALMGTFESTGAVPISTPVEVVFGVNAAGQIWGFTGFINSVQITYGIFRYDMIPSRCEVALGMMTVAMGSQIPPGGGKATSGGGAAEAAGAALTPAQIAINTALSQDQQAMTFNN